jgi:iron(III) transport system substrate-binding protein
MSAPRHGPQPTRQGSERLWPLASRLPRNPGSGLLALLILLSIALIALAAAHLLPALLTWARGEALVVYCAHDAIYSEKILRDFERKTGIRVDIVFDTEATKSLGLVERLIREKDAPRCDVFWNNQLLGTVDLQERGVLDPYHGPGYQRVPASFKDPDAHWAGFGARFRVYIVNTKKLAATEAAVAKALHGNLPRVAMAKPLYGTTLTHYAILWDHWGPDKLKAWHRDWRLRGVHEVGGNAQSKSLVAEGICDLGLTDTDDFFVARDEGKPVAMLPVRLEDGSTLCDPNTVCIIRGTRRMLQAQ